MLFNCIHYDSNSLPSGTVAAQELSFFTDGGKEKAPRAVNEDEQPLIRWLFGNPLSRRLILDNLGCSPQARYALEVTEPVAKPHRKPGELDVLIWPPGQPQRTMALECKRVKVDHGKVNKLRAIGEVVSQANGLRNSYGFFQNYMVALIVVDVHRHAEPGRVPPGPEPHIMKRIYEFNRRDRLHDDVGVIFIEVNQSTRKHISRSGTIGVRIDKRAKLIDQTTELTNRMRELEKRQENG